MRADQLKDLIALGLPIETLQKVVEIFDRPSRGALRQHNYRVRKASPDRNDSVTCDAQSPDNVLDINNYKNKNTPISLSTEDTAAGEEAVTVMRGLRNLPDSAAALHRAVGDALEADGFKVTYEVHAGPYGRVRQGRIDLFASKAGGSVAIELDTRKPRNNSTLKLRMFQAYRIIGLRGVDAIPPDGIHAVVNLSVRAATVAEANDKRTVNRVAISSSEILEWFEEIWQEYPKRDGDNPKKPAREKFEAVVRKGKATPEQIARGVIRLAEKIAKAGTDPKYVPQMITWLNQERWDNGEAAAEPQGGNRAYTGAA